jgi:hypothetical protein
MHLLRKAVCWVILENVGIKTNVARVFQHKYKTALKNLLCP